MTKLFLSKEDQEIESKLLTQESLIDLGKTIAFKELEKNQKITHFHDLKVWLEINKNFKMYSFKKKHSTLHNYYSVNYYCVNEINNYIEEMNKYVKILEDTKLENEMLIDKIKVENQELLEEKKNLNEESNQLDAKYNEREKYWTNRVENLRKKCKRKNNIIKFVYYFIILLILNFSIIYYINIINYINFMYLLSNKIYNNILEIITVFTIIYLIISIAKK